MIRLSPVEGHLVVCTIMHAKLCLPEVTSICSYFGRSSNVISTVECVSVECIRDRPHSCDSSELTVDIVWRIASWKSYVALRVECGVGDTVFVLVTLEVVCASVSCDGELVASMSKMLMSVELLTLPLAPWHKLHE